MATTPLQLIKKVWERFVTEMLTCRALQQVVDGSLIRMASTPSGHRKRFEQDSLKKSWDWGPCEEGWDQWGWWRDRRLMWGGVRGGRRRGTGGGATVEMYACWLKSRQYPDFFSVSGNHGRSNLLTHRDQARCSGGPSPPLFAHRFYISCSSSKLCFLAKL